MVLGSWSSLGSLKFSQILQGVQKFNWAHILNQCGFMMVWMKSFFLIFLWLILSVLLPVSWRRSAWTASRWTATGRWIGSLSIVLFDFLASFSWSIDGYLPSRSITVRRGWWRWWAVWSTSASVHKNKIYPSLRYLYSGQLFCLY